MNADKRRTRIFEVTDTTGNDIIYRVRGKTVQILRVLHTSKQYSRWVIKTMSLKYVWDFFTTDEDR